MLLLTWDYPPGRGGIQRWMHEIARGLPTARVRVIAPDTPGSRAFDGAEDSDVRRLSTTGGQFMWLLRTCVAGAFECWRSRPDVIVCGHVLAGPAAWLVSRLFGVPYVVFAYAFEIRGRRWRRLVSFFLRKADLVIAISRFTRDAVLEHNVPEERIRVLYPGADVTTDVMPRAACRNGRFPTLLTVSRLADLYKGHDTMIRALPLVRSKFPDVRYVIVGDGPLRSGLTRLAETLDVGHHVEFLGEVGDDELARLYRECDVVVQLSREARTGGGAEGFGIVCLEASAAGKPVIAGRSGGIPDAIDHGVTGLLVDPLNLSDVVDAVVTLLSNPNLASQLGAQGRAKVAAGMTWAHMNTSLRTLLTQTAATY